MFPAIPDPLLINPATRWEMPGWPILPCVSKRWLPVVVPSAGSKMDLLRVGPESAGASPRACLLWVWRPALFDRCEFTARTARSIPAFPHPWMESASHARLQELAESLRSNSQDDLLHGFLAVADDAMANAIRKVSVAEGYDPVRPCPRFLWGCRWSACLWGGGEVGMKKILSPGDSGLLSAYGLSQARLERIRNSPSYCPWMIPAFHPSRQD
jgi:5-oxoprolinase (ATP-hydrolysing)